MQLVLTARQTQLLVGVIPTSPSGDQRLKAGGTRDIAVSEVGVPVYQHQSLGMVAACRTNSSMAQTTLLVHDAKLLLRH